MKSNVLEERLRGKVEGVEAQDGRAAGEQERGHKQGHQEGQRKKQTITSVTVVFRMVSAHAH